MPKPVMATAQDVKELDARLSGEVSRVEALIGPAITAAEGKLKAQLGGLDGKVSSGFTEAKASVESAREDAKRYTDDSCKAVHGQIMPEFDPIRAEFPKMEKNFNEKLTDLDGSLRELMKTELQSLTVKFDDIVSDLKSELLKNMETWAREAAQALVDQRQELDKTIEEVKTEAKADNKSDREAAEKALSDVVEAQEEKDNKQDERANRAYGEIYVKITQLSEKLTAEMNDKHEKVCDTHNNHKAEYEIFVSDTDKHLTTLDDDSNSLRNAMSEVENVSTRRVDWVIKNVSKKIRPLSPSRTMLHTSWFSPKFDAAGAYGMQLELQLFRNSDPPVDGEDAGDVAIHLWACKGMNLAYKLSCGNKAVQLEKAFNGRVPFGTKRFCFIKEQINKEDDTLKVSVEILEAIREVEHVVKPPVILDDPDGPPKSLEELTAEAQIKEKALDSSMFFQRTINNRLYDQVKQQVHVLQSRMVRKIEWRVENASLLRRCFPANECICSASFSAAGIEGMQFIFYPSGYKGATEGYCSLFLFGPAGATLKCQLAAGKQQRDASHTFDEPGAFGRTNFCRFESCVDEVDDSIMMLLDIEDAQQDSVALVKHPVVQPGDRRSLAQLEGQTDKPIDSIVKLTKQPGGRAQGKGKDLVELKVLPSLWTAQALGTQTARNDGMHEFEDIKIKAKAGLGPRRTGASVSFFKDSSMESGGSMARGTSSMPTMPSLRDASTRSAIEEDLRPSLNASHEGNFLKKAEERRRPKANLGASLTAMQ